MDVYDYSFMMGLSGLVSGFLIALGLVFMFLGR